MKKWIVTLVVGLILATGAFWGMIGTVLGMTRTFSHIAEPQPEVSAIASTISLALYTTVAGLIVCPIGIGLVVLAAIKLSQAKAQDIR